MNFNVDAIVDSTQEATLAFTTTPRIGTDGQRINLEDVHYIEEQELPSGLTAALVAQVSEVLNLLPNLKRKEMSLQIQQLNVAVGKLTLQATVDIEQFPS